MSRPKEKTPETIRKIEEAAAMDCSIEEMAFFANIHRATLYRWINEDKKLSDRIDELKMFPILKARQEIIKGLNNYQNAMDYLKRKKRLEFGDNVDHTTQGEKLKIQFDESFNSTQKTERDNKQPSKI